MANRFAIADADFALTSTWSTTAGGAGGASVPVAGDSAIANNHIVQITTSQTCTDLRNDTQGSATAGGYFNCATAGVTIAANVVAGANVTNKGCLTAAHTSGTVTLTGNVTTSVASAVGVRNDSTGTLGITGTISAGNIGSSSGVLNASTGTVNVVGNVPGSSSGGGATVGISQTAAGTVNVTGDATGSASGSGATNHAISASAGTVTVTGNCTGAQNGAGVNATTVATVTVTGNCTGGSGAAGVIFSASGVLTVTGTVTGGTANSTPGISASGAGTIKVNGTLQASTSATALSSTATATQVSGPVKSASNGILGIFCANWTWLTPVIATYLEVRTAGTLALRSLYTADSVGGNPAVTDVRNGTVYGPAGGTITGTAYIPAAASVASGVNVDATTGTAVITATGLLTALGMATANMDTQLSAIAGKNVMNSGTAQAGGASTITLASGASATDDLYVGCVVSIGSGAGAGQARTILSYVGSTKVATLGRAWVTNPSNTSVYSIIGLAAPKVNSSLEVTAASVTGNVTGSVGSVVSYGTLVADTATAVWASSVRSLSTFGTLVADTVTAVWSAVARTITGTVTLAASQPNYAPAVAGDAMALTPSERTATANEVEAQIIDDTDSEKVLAAIVAKIAAANPDLSGLTLSAIAAAVRTELAAELTRIDVATSSRASQTSVDDIPTNAEFTAGLDAADDATLAEIAALTIPSAATIAAAVRDVSNSAPAAGSLGEAARGADAKAAVLIDTIGAPAGATVSADIAQIIERTDRLPDDPADESLIINATNAIMTRLGVPAGASVSVDIAAVRAAIAALDPATSTALATAVTAILDAIADKTGYRLSATGVSDVLRSTLTEGYATAGAALTLEQGIYMLISYVFNKSATGTTLTANEIDGVTPSMTFTLDKAKNPTSQVRAT